MVFLSRPYCLFISELGKKYWSAWYSNYLSLHSLFMHLDMEVTFHVIIFIIMFFFLYLGC